MTRKMNKKYAILVQGPNGPSAQTCTIQHQMQWEPRRIWNAPHHIFNSPARTLRFNVYILPYSIASSAIWHTISSHPHLSLVISLHSSRDSAQTSWLLGVLSQRWVIDPANRAYSALLASQMSAFPRVPLPSETRHESERVEACFLENHMVITWMIHKHLWQTTITLQAS